ncbi:MAG: D-alanine--D-alanine ligase family protein [Actinomycetota bacterium]
MSERRTRVMLIFGGQSAEHDVSCTTAVAAAKSFDPQRYEIVPVAIGTDGRWHLATEAARLLAAGDPDALPKAFAVEGEVIPVPSPAIVRDDLAVDVAFPLLHGPYGEDGTVQGLLEIAGIPYVGAGVLGSAVGMDKVAMKRLLGTAGVPIARWLALRDGHDRDGFADRVAAEIGFPCFVKPANMGSSVGVTRAPDRAALAAALDLAFTYDEWVLVEEEVGGREIEVGVLGDDPPVASVPGEIEGDATFLDYENKYETGTVRLLVPAELTAEQTDEVRRLAVQAFEACRCEAMARVDFFLRDGRFTCNELNTIPGFTPFSMYPAVWQASGLSYPALLDRLIELAFARHARRSARRGVQR